METNPRPVRRPPGYDVLWKEMIDMFRRERPLLLALCGFFLLLPTVMLYVFLPPVPQPTGDDNALLVIQAYLQQHQPEFLFHTLWVAFGQLAIAVVLAAPDKPTVGEALVRALRLFPWHVLQTIIVLLTLIGGALMLILPALYFAGRLSLCTVLLATGEGRSPFALIRRSQELTRGAGWHLSAFIVLLWLGTTLFSSAIGTISSALFAQFGKTGVAHVADATIQGMAALPWLLLWVLFQVALLRQLNPRE